MPEIKHITVRVEPFPPNNTAKDLMQHELFMDRVGRLHEVAPSQGEQPEFEQVFATCVDIGYRLLYVAAQESDVQRGICRGNLEAISKAWNYLLQTYLRIKERGGTDNYLSSMLELALEAVVQRNPHKLRGIVGTDYPSDSYPTKSFKMVTRNALAIILPSPE